MKLLQRNSNLIWAMALVWLFATACNDDDDPLTATISFSDPTLTISEDATTPLTITVNLSRAFDQAITVPFTVAGTAIEGTDYETISPKSVTLAQGATSATLSVTPINNNFVETAERTLTITLTDPGIEGITLAQTPAVTITFTSEDQAGSVLVDFDQDTYQFNEYLDANATITVNTSATFAEDITLNYTIGGTAVAGTNYTAPATTQVTILAGQREATISIDLIDTDNFDQSTTLELSLQAPENTAIGLGNTASTTVSLVNPLANTRVFAVDEDFPRLWGYNTFADEPVPAMGRQNSDPANGTIYDESFAFTLYDAARPNSIGFVSPLWSQEEFTRNTNAFNMIVLYSNGPDEVPSAIDENISSGSAGIAIFEALRLVPSAPGATSGTVVVVPQQVTVYRRDETDDGVVNPTSFEIGISGQGTYNEATGTLEITVTYDETAINNGTNVRRFVMAVDRRAS